MSECGVYCEACGDCMRCCAEDWCYGSADGKHWTSGVDDEGRTVVFEGDE